MEFCEIFYFLKSKDCSPQVIWSVADVSANVRGKGTIVSQLKSVALRARTLSFCLLGAIIGSCGVDRVNPKVPAEFVPEEEQIESSGVRSEDISVLGSVNVERNRPVDSSTDIIIYTPAEEPKKVPVLTDCTTPYQITATTNPFLAGMPGNSSIAYPLSTDRAPRNAPIQMLPNDAQCLESGRALYFKVDGRIAFGDMPGQDSNRMRMVRVPRLSSTPWGT
jgi:hypothetical protein